MDNESIDQVARYWANWEKVKCAGWLTGLPT